MIKKIIIIIIFILNTTLSYAEENKKEANSQKKRKKPDHIITTSYKYSGAGIIESHGCSLFSMNKFHINKKASLTNIFNFSYSNNDGRLPIPMNLYLIQNNLRFQYESATLIIGYRTNTDRPYMDFKDVNLNSSILIEIYKKGPHSFKIGIFYFSQISNLIGYSIPIPMFTYSYITRKLEINFGFFTRIVWRPVKYFTFRFMYFLAINGSASFIFKPLPFLHLSTDINSKSNAYLLNKREIDKERLYHDYIQVGERITLYISRFASIFVYAGYRFFNTYTYSKGMFRELMGDYRLKYTDDQSFELKTGMMFMF